MYPVLFKIGSVEFYSYGLMLGLGFIAGTYVASRRAEKRGISPDSLFWLFIYLLVGGVVGGRVLHVALNLQYYNGIGSIIDTREGGLSIHGVLIGGLIVMAVYSRRHKLSMAYLLDVIIPGVALGQAIGRVGCLFAGCCYGVETSGSWGVTTRFAQGLRHPYQLYEGAADLLIFFGLLWLSDRVKLSGRLFASYAIVYSVSRFFLEFLRDNDSYAAGLSYGQWASVAGAIAGVSIWTLVGRRSRDTSQNAASE